MTPIKRTVRFFLAITIIEALLVALILAIISMLSARDANAHVLQPSICDAAWRAAPPGHKWQAKQRCLAIVANHNCRLHPRPVPRSIEVKSRRADSGQRHVAGWLVSEALRRRLPRVVAEAALIGTTQEATARELRHGEGTSVGPFQLIDTHGSFEQRVTIEFSGNWFFNGAVKELRRLGPMSAPALAQEVEESGNPGAYQQWLPESRQTLVAILGSCRLR